MAVLFFAPLCHNRKSMTRECDRINGNVAYLYRKNFKNVEQKSRDSRTRVIGVVRADKYWKKED